MWVVIHMQDSKADTLVGGGTFCGKWTRWLYSFSIILSIWPNSWWRYSGIRSKQLRNGISRSDPDVDLQIFIHTLFCKLAQPQCCLTFLWIKPQMFRRYWLIYVNIIIPRLLLYLGLDLCQCPGLDLLISYLCDFFYFHFRFHYNWSYNLFKTDLFYDLWSMPYCFWLIAWIKSANNFQIAKFQPQSVA